ncbi:DotI/IcmL/TraM family protein [Vibrio tubiashii]|uniref:DotI/IcmL/TraM family protein n=1 Tax=Vibrio tubiashii TaxID=29498 RepID=UPI001EFCC2E0|nr:DotI/IcmL/TraM family protein [Vibrio tubiashii]MCG9579577.1 DotI/IcmL/TraM family protein [Vibrio tubiashii]
MKHTQSLLVSVLTLLMIVLVGFLSYSINQSPQRNAYIMQNGKLTHLNVRTFSALSDRTLINFAEHVAVTCFSLTPLNYQTKSDYCAEQYFSANPAAIYKTKYAEREGAKLAEQEATLYATAKRKPIIVVSWEKTQFQYYVVVVPLTTTEVRRNERIPKQKLARLWITPKRDTVNPYQFEIVGLKI